MNVKNRTIFEGDNLHILRGLDSQSIDLIYLDPPFNSNRNYSAPIGSEAAGAAFKDTWTLSDIDNAWHGEIAEREPALYQAIHASELTHGKSMKSYLIMMAVRLLEMKRVLKDTGSIYLHCDTTASHYLKVVMDSVLGKNNFRNEISWKRINVPKSTKGKFGAVHDTILLYSKSNSITFNQVYSEYDPEYVKQHYRHKDNYGYWRPTPLTASGTRNGYSGMPWRNIDPSTKGHHWVVPKAIPSHIVLPDNWETLNSLERLDFYDSVGLIYFPQKSDGVPAFKRYLSTTKGVATSDMINDIPSIQGSSKEKVGYPTQKPLALLQRIIKSSSNEGDIILDPFCGCATTCVAAEQLGRQWIGIDISPKAIQLVRIRLEKEVGFFGEVIQRTDIPKRSEKLPNYRTHKHTVYGKQEGYCNGCKGHFPFRNMTVDHIVPRSKGGIDHEENLQLLCGACNSTKNNDTQAELIARLKKQRIL
jgi:DNA modification methylase